MPSYKFDIAKAVLNDVDKNRILCIYLSSDQTSIDWHKATNDFGSASVESFRRTVYNMLKKIEDAGGRDDGEGQTSPAKKTKAKAKKSRAKKRKAADDSDIDDIEEAHEAPARKVPKRGAVVKYECPDSSEGEEAVDLKE